MLKVGDKAVYPAHGVGVVSGMESKEYSGVKQTFYIFKILDKDVTIMIPQNNVNQVGLRAVIQQDKVAKIYEILKQKKEVAIPQASGSWNRRHREYMDKIKTGSLFEVAEVLRDLYVLKLDKELSFGERKVFDHAKWLLIKELSVSKRTKEDKIEQEFHKVMAAHK